MEYFHSSGGNTRPYFTYRIKVFKCTAEMYDWCYDFDSDDVNFRRWHVEWKNFDSQRMPTDHEIVQFEWREAASMFLLTWGGELV
jgi:hypothetical protein